MPRPSLFFRCLIALLLAGAPLARAGGQTATTAGLGSGVVPNAFDGIVLTAEQSTRLAALTAATRFTRDSILARRTSGGTLSAASLSALRTLAAQHHGSLVAVLTPDQAARLDANLTARRAAIAAAVAARVHP